MFFLLLRYINKKKSVVVLFFTVPKCGFIELCSFGFNCLRLNYWIPDFQNCGWNNFSKIILVALFGYFHLGYLNQIKLSKYFDRSLVWNAIQIPKWKQMLHFEIGIQSKFECCIFFCIVQNVCGNYHCIHLSPIQFVLCTSNEMSKHTHTHTLMRYILLLTTMHPHIKNGTGNLGFDTKQINKL